MLWSWKELGLFKDNISEDQQQNITKINWRYSTRNSERRLWEVKSQVEDLKMAMKICN
jgi:hypothetical protein